jgi:hypothetical protein
MASDGDTPAPILAMLGHSYGLAETREPRGGYFIR